MAKKAYSSPRFFGLEEREDPHINLPPSQSTSGEDPIYTLDEGIGEYFDLDMIELWCGDDDFVEMDNNRDYVISLAEFQAWWNSHPERHWD